MNLLEELGYCTVHLKCPQTSGTGFIYSVGDEQKSIPLLITNKHVIDGAKKCELTFTINKNNIEKPCTVGVDLNNNVITHPNRAIDLCAIMIGRTMNGLERQMGDHIVYRSFDKSLIPNCLDGIKAIEDIFVVGYPNAIWDSINNKPIVRRGITATNFKYDYEGKKEFLIDCSIFPGSSGSPVILANDGMYVNAQGTTVVGQKRTFLLGIVYAVMQSTQFGDIVPVPVDHLKVRTATSIPNNLGVAIKSSELLYFDEHLKDLLHS